MSDNDLYKLAHWRFNRINGLDVWDISWNNLSAACQKKWGNDVLLFISQNSSKIKSVIDEVNNTKKD
jgi:hypothetical protein